MTTNGSGNGAQTIPAPDASNPIPRPGDRWFNYRSLQEVSIIAIEGTRVSLLGHRSNKRGTTDLEDFAVPRFFKFIRHEEPTAPTPPREPPMERLIAAVERMIAAQHETNEKLDRLLQVWEGPRS